jgi:hypothetical protein
MSSSNVTSIHEAGGRASRPPRAEASPRIRRLAVIRARDSRFQLIPVEAVVEARQRLGGAAG